MMRQMNPVVKALIMALLFAAMVLSAMYFRSEIIEKQPFSPDWIVVVGAFVLFFVADLVRERMNL